MTQIGVVSVASRRSARRKRSFFNSVISTSVRAFEALGKHQAETALELCIARLFKGADRRVTLEELLALHGRATPLGAGFAIQRPAAEQVLLQRDLDVAWCLG